MISFIKEILIYMYIVHVFDKYMTKTMFWHFLVKLNKTAANSVVALRLRNGPDWKSGLRPIRSPHSDTYPAEESWPNKWLSLRTFPGNLHFVIKCRIYTFFKTIQCARK